MELGEPLSDTLVDYRQEFMDIYRITNVTKYRSFQYRLLQRGLVTNIQLEKWNIVSSAMCTFCRCELETVPHLLWFCPQVQHLWFAVLRYMRQYCWDIPQQPSVTQVLLNKLCDVKGHVVNFMCLITKQYIYRKRCQKESTSFPELKNIFRGVENIEKYIATKNNKLPHHLFFVFRQQQPYLFTIVLQVRCR